MQKLRAASAMLRGSKVPEGARFQRGTSTLGGPVHSAVPNYVVLQCLQQALKVPKGCWDKVQTDMRRRIFLFAVGAEDLTPLPGRQMGIEQFIQWYLEKYSKMGERLSEFSIEDGRVQITPGAYGYFRLGKSSDSSGFDLLINNLTGDSAKLPNNVCISVEELNKHYYFQDNH
eukprot:1819845-Lingulodinium_polyedra.AAC.1